MNEPAWMSHDDVTQPITIVAARPYPQVFVALGTVGYVARAAMHYVPELKRSVPHTTPHCSWCRYPAVKKCWFPVQQAPLAFGRDIFKLAVLKGCPKVLADDSTWPAKVLEIPPSGSALLAGLDPGRLFAVVRGQGKFTQKVEFRIFDQTVGNILPAFDCIPFLRKCWGLVNSPGNSMN